jgi:hypothetical protein
VDEHHSGRRRIPPPPPRAILSSVGTSDIRLVDRERIIASQGLSSLDAFVWVGAGVMSAV